MYSIKTNKNILRLSSEIKVYKTDKFIRQTHGMAYVDLILNNIKNAIIEEVVLGQYKGDNSLLVTTIDEENKFFIKILNNNKQKEIIFYKYSGKEKKGINLDRRFNKYLFLHSDIIEFNISIIKDEESNFNKLYILANSDEVNMPLLNKEQEKIVRMEDNNILVQGVAGSGKTNICIDKIVYAASRHYLGKTLYSTYSHALLVETKKKIDQFNNNIKEFIRKYENNEIRFLDDNKHRAIENYLGVIIDESSGDTIGELKQISQYLYEKVHYKLIENFYEDLNKHVFADEQFFYKTYIQNIKNYNLYSSLDKIKYLSYEIIYKEIYGIIYGTYYKGLVNKIIPIDDYIELRKESFSTQEAKIIYMLAQDYYSYLDKNNILDNNIISRKLLSDVKKQEEYSLVVLDEVQDFTQVNLNFFKNITIKLFCVGDVLQMINPTYFSFAYLKRLMFDENISSVIELKNNYRNTKKIERLIDNLSQLNIEQFGTHNFVIRSQSVDSDVFSNTIYTNDISMFSMLNTNVYYDFTIVVSSIKNKQELLKKMPKQEILTVSEIKGLERGCIILYDILSDNIDKWNAFKRNIISKKKADENSIYRYYFNLLYVGISRARENLIVVEQKDVELFRPFFKEGFEYLGAQKVVDVILKHVKKTDIDEREIQKRIDEFIRLEQYDNARFNASRLPEEEDVNLQLNRIAIYEKHIKKNEFRKAGIELWKIGFFEDAKSLFILSHDEKLIELIETSQNSNGQKLEYDIVQFYNDVQDNKDAVDLILETLDGDLKDLKQKQNEILKNIKRMKNR